MAMPPLAPPGSPGRLAQRSTPGRVLEAFGLNLLRGVLLAVAIHGDVDHAQVHAQEVCGRGLGSVRDVDRDQQEPLAVLAKYQVALTLRPAEPISLILPHDVGNDHAAFEGRDAHAIGALEADVLAHAERDGRVLAELRSLVLVWLVRFNHLGYAPYRCVGRESEPFAKLGIAKLLKRELVGDLPLERDTCQPGGGFVEPFDRRLQLGGRLWIGQELGLERDVHATIVLVLSSKVKTGGPLLIPGPHTMWGVLKPGAPEAAEIGGRPAEDDRSAR